MGREWRQAWRGLRQAPFFTVMTIATLALGLGGTVSMFAAVNAAFLKPLPFAEPGRLVKVYQTSARSTQIRVPLPVLRDWHRDRTQLVALAGYLAGSQINIGVESEARRARLARVTQPFFAAMQAAPIRGRVFGDAEATPGAPATVVISHGVWQELFGGRDDVLERSLLVESVPVPIIGVMPEGFDFPERTDVWTTVDRDPADAWSSRTAHNFDVVGRLGPDATPASAQRELNALSLEQQRLDAGMAREQNGVAVTDLRADLLGSQSIVVLIGLGAVLCLLVVCCVNVANLMLARSVTRETETGIRLALGASRLGLVKAVLAEGLLLAGAGGLLGVLISLWATRLVESLTPISVTGGAPLSIDWRVLLLTLGITTVAGLICAALPAWRSTGVDARGVLAAGARTVTAAPRRAMHALVAVEVALAFVVLFGAGLLGRTYAALGAVDLGFRTTGLVLANISVGALPNSPYGTPEARRQMLERLEQSVASAPGVRAVGLAALMPLGFTPNGRFVIEGRTEVAQAHFRLVGGDYFGVMGIPVRRGRAFTSEDGPAQPQVAVINETLARQIFGAEDPIGARVSMPGMDGGSGIATIVGITADVRHRGPDQPPVAEAYFSYRQRPWRTYGMTLIVDAALPEAATIAIVRDRLRAIDPLVPPAFQTMAARAGLVLEPSRFRATLIATLAAMTLALALVGIVGVVSYVAARRTREIGVRVALGATPRSIAGLVLRGGLWPVAGGIVVGAIAALGLAQVLRAFLFEIDTRDPGTLLMVAAALVGAGVAGCWWPARRAARISPVRALRG